MSVERIKRFIGKGRWGIAGVLLVVATFLWVGLAPACGAAATPRSTPVSVKQPLIPAVPLPNEVKVVGNITTVGNLSYITLGLGGIPSEHLSEIFQARLDFERLYPELEIVDWDIDKQQYAHFTQARIYGIWVEHRPKQKPK